MVAQGKRDRSQGQQLELVGLGLMRRRLVRLDADVYRSGRRNHDPQRQHHLLGRHLQLLRDSYGA
jgi:hypothetical protein